MVETPIANLPGTILKQYHKVTLCIDMMFVNKIAMMATISWNIKFGTVEPVPDRKESTITDAVQNVVRLYKGAGYKVIMIMVDGKFSYLKLPIGEQGITVNVTSRDEHVADIE